MELRDEVSVGVVRGGVTTPTRRLMIEKIAVHIADFTPRLTSNTRATYQYCAIPVIQYPQLDNELFCNIYYLRHLCDTVKFPGWPIKDPVSGIYLVYITVCAICYSPSLPLLSLSSPPPLLSSPRLRY